MDLIRTAEAFARLSATHIPAGNCPSRTWLRATINPAEGLLALRVASGDAPGACLQAISSPSFCQRRLCI
jgi:hypothetical protein